MKSIKFCRKYQNNKNISVETTLGKYGFLLRRSNYISELKENVLIFKRPFRSTADSNENTTKGSII